ncbi:hypothetical protein CF327_g4187 [Tilletia walkeri]|uniref:Uncharacterized protein n=1 Tax=Tilletia walkeri TaxID=117179 RepID=A0A8X7NB28_9BASI|nr:hypothetical protein CF327_g4187 [Tilletia walkeri]KAE8268935.1 hypothetical protein A4X09_0g3398 [Tilletia walkeri]
MTDSQPQQPAEKKSKKSTRSTKKQQQQQQQQQSQTAGKQENSSDSSMGVASSSTSFDIPIAASGSDTLDPSSSASPMNTSPSDLASLNGTNTPPASPSTNNNLSFQVNSPIPSVLGLQQHPAVVALTHAFEPVGYPVPSVVGTLPLTEADIQRLHGPAIAYLDKLSEFTYNESRHTSALQHIAETDTWPEDGPEWNDELRLAIQHRLLTAFRAYPLPGEVQPELHRAAPLIPLLLQRHHQQMQQAHFAQMGGAGGPLGPGPGQGQGQGSLPMTGQPDGNGNGTGGAPASGELPPSNGNEGGLGLEPTGGADTSKSAAVLAQAGLASRFVSASTLDAAASALSISPADLSSFYPSKRHLHHFHLVQQQQHLQQQQQLQQQLLLQNPQDQSTTASVPAAAPSADGGEPSSTEPANVGTGPSTSASQTVLNNSGRAVNVTGPALYAPQIPLKHAEVMLYQLFSNSFSLEPASAAEKKDVGKGGADASGTKSGEDVDATGKDKEGGGEVGKAELDGGSGTKPESEETADSAAAGASGSSTDLKAEAPAKSDEAMDTAADPAPPTPAAAVEPSAVGPRPSAIPPSSSSQSVSSFGFAPNTSLLPINDSSTPLFIGSPPFTIQRLAELALEPRRHHASSTKFLHALERVLRVTARWDSVKEHDVAIAGPGAGAEGTEGKDADGSSEVASLPATEGDASVLPVNSMADATQTMASAMPATAPTTSSSNSTPTSTAERTIKRMRSERSLKGR